MITTPESSGKPITGHPALLLHAVSVADLQPHPLNARRRDARAQAAIRESLREHGQYRALVARQLDDCAVQLLAGHGVLTEVLGLGWSHVAVDVHDGIGDEQAARIVAIDNRTGDLSYDDPQALLALLEAGGVWDGPAFDGDDLAELRALAAAADGPAALTDVDDAPDLPAERDVVSQDGDVYDLGPHRLVVGDATDPAVLTELLGRELAGCLWTDPPYGVDYEGKTADALTIRNDGRDGLHNLLARSLAVATRSVRPGAPVYVAAPPGPQTLAFAQVLTDLQVWRQTLVWVKDVLVLGHSDYHYRHEVIYAGYTPGGQGRRGRGGEGWHGDNAQTTVLEVPKPKRSAEHPTMKPVELIARCLENSTRPGQLVLDVFGGSGSTLIACHSLGRRAALVELDPAYADVICRRWQAHTGVVPVRFGVPVSFLDEEPA